MNRLLAVGGVGLAGAAVSTGCILPVSTGAPMPATTVGKGHIGGSMQAEAPVLDLLADEDNSNAATNDPIRYGAAPAAALGFTISYGVGDNTDLELTGEGALYFFIIPLPTGGSLGIRQHFDAGESLDIAVAARVGHVSSSSESTDSNGNKSEYGASANFGQLQLVGQLKTEGTLRPLVALNLMPARINRRFTNDPDYDFNGFASSLTFGLMFVGNRATVGPYVTGTNFYSDRFDNVGWFVSGGFIIAARPDRNRKPEPPPAYNPQPQYYPPPGYPPPGYPNAVPPPPPPPPTTDAPPPPQVQTPP